MNDCVTKPSSSDPIVEQISNGMKSGFESTVLFCLFIFYLKKKSFFFGGGGVHARWVV